MLELEHICFSYGKKEILRNITLSLPASCLAVLTGPNGSGKTTLLRLAAGALKPQSGRVQKAAAVGYVPQTTALFPDLTVRDNLLFFAQLAHAPLPEALPFGVEALLQERVLTLSGGSGKRVSLAAGLLGNPRLLLLDEPYSGLDASYRQELTGLLRRFRDGGGSILMVSHEPAEYAKLCDRRFRLEDTLLKELSPSEP